MYAMVGLLKSSPVSGKLAGTHQKLDRVARKLLSGHLPRGVYFPSAKEIVYFEGTRGPDGLKRKSPGVDEISHFIIPDADDGKLIKIITNHHYNLAGALRAGDHVRAAFEAAWLAHAITDGLTPAHHVPLSEQANKLMTNKEFVKIFGAPIKGIMHGRNFLQTARNNWLYWGAGGAMSQHLAFEYGLAVMATVLAPKNLCPKDLRPEDWREIDFRHEFYRSLAEVADLDMYGRFRRKGWTGRLALDSKEVLFPVVVRTVALSWMSAVEEVSGPAGRKKPAGEKNTKDGKPALRKVLDEQSKDEKAGKTGKTGKSANQQSEGRKARKTSKTLNR